jgi:hypothetical protein
LKPPGFNPRVYEVVKTNLVVSSFRLFQTQQPVCRYGTARSERASTSGGAVQVESILTHGLKVDGLKPRPMK